MKEVLLNDGNLADIARLRSRWVMMEASKIMEARNVTRSYALISAWRAWRLLDALSQGKVFFSYKKETGDTRMAVGTLCRGIDRHFDDYLSKNAGRVKDAKRESCCFVYWDIEKEGFRTFKSYQLLPDMNVFSLGTCLTDDDDEQELSPRSSQRP